LLFAAVASFGILAGRDGAEITVSQAERRGVEELVHGEGDEIVVFFRWSPDACDLDVLVDGGLRLRFAIEAESEQGLVAPHAHRPAQAASPEPARRNITVTRPVRAVSTVARGSSTAPRGVRRIRDAARSTPVLQRLAHTTAQRLRLTTDDGTPTQWWDVINIYAPVIVVISIVAAAILKQ
jgi:hypothetical protein